MNIQQIQTQVTPILKAFSVKRASLFGSYARQADITPSSDIDILVELNKPISLLKFIDLKQQLEESLNKKVDLVQYKKIKPSLKDYILEDEQVLYQS